MEYIGMSHVMNPSTVDQIWKLTSTAVISSPASFTFAEAWRKTHAAVSTGISTDSCIKAYEATFPSLVLYYTLCI